LPFALPKATPDAAAVAPGAFPGDERALALSSGGRVSSSSFLARVVRRKCPADNSCLFHAVGFCMHRSTGRAPFLRRVVAREVASDPGGQYSEAFLGMGNAEYTEWIMQPQV